MTNRWREWVSSNLTSGHRQLGPKYAVRRAAEDLNGCRKVDDVAPASSTKTGSVAYCTASNSTVVALPMNNRFSIYGANKRSRAFFRRDYPCSHEILHSGCQQRSGDTSYIVYAVGLFCS